MRLIGKTVTGRTVTGKTVTGKTMRLNYFENLTMNFNQYLLAHFMAV